MPDDHAHSHHHTQGSELSEMDVRVRALETILTEKGYVDPAALDKIVEAFETRIGPHNGARIVARAWIDPEFKRRLLADATEAANSLGEFGPRRQPPDRGREHADTSITSSSAPCAPVIRGRCWGCRRSGTNRRPTARAR